MSITEIEQTEKDENIESKENNNKGFSASGIDAKMFKRALVVVKELRNSSMKKTGDVHLHYENENKIRFSVPSLDGFVDIYIPCKESNEGDSFIYEYDNIAPILKKVKTEYFNLDEVGSFSFNSIVVNSIKPYEICGNTEKAVIENKDESILINGIALKEGFMKCVDFTDEGNNKYSLAGVLMDFDNGLVDFVATDGVALLHSQYMNGEDNIGHLPHVIPVILKNFLEFIENDEIVKIDCSDNRFKMKGQKISLTLRCIEGRYPSWKRIIPSLEDRKSFLIPIKEVQYAVDFINSTPKTKNKTRKIGICISDYKIAIMDGDGQELRCFYSSHDNSGSISTLWMDNDYFKKIVKSAGKDGILNVYFKNMISSVYIEIIMSNNNFIKTEGVVFPIR